MKYKFLALAAAVSSPAYADVVITGTNPASPADFVIRAEARNGRTGQEGILRSPSGFVNMNPQGAPVWQFGTDYNFAFSYGSDTGTSTWNIDFNRDGDFLDAQESVSALEPSLAGFGFQTASLLIQGSGTSGVSVSTFSLNGTNFGPFSVGDGALDTIFGDTSGVFANVDATGTFQFTGTSNSQERPRLWLRLGDQVSLAGAVPEPTTWALLILGFGAIGGAMRRKATVAVRYA